MNFDDELFMDDMELNLNEFTEEELRGTSEKVTEETMESKVEDDLAVMEFDYTKDKKKKKGFLKKHKKAFSIASTLLILFVGYFVGGMTYEKTTDKLFFPFLGYRVSIATDDSMSPYMTEKAIVISKKTKNVKENDVIVFKNASDKTLIRRYMGLFMNDTIITKGDSNLEKDRATVPKNEVQGKVVFVLNK